MKFKILNSVSELESVSEAWDDLWSRSDVVLPTAKAEPLSICMKHFSASQTFRAVVVEHDQRFLAAFPLVGHRIAPSVEVGRLTHSDWSTGGDLMIDPSVDPAAVARQLGLGLRELPWPLLWMTACRRDLPAWRLLLNEWSVSAPSVVSHERFDVGVVDVPDDFAQFESSWSRNHRRHMRKANRKLDAGGDWELTVSSDLAADEVEPMLRMGFEMEHNGWKGQAGSSVVATPGMFEFYLKQARSFAALGHLQMVFLLFQGKPIAFEYGWIAKGRYFTPKVAYAEKFAQYTPGQLLRYKYLQRMSQERPGETIDFLGPLSEATLKWSTETYQVDTVLVALRPIVGRALVSAYQALRRARRLSPALPVADAGDLELASVPTTRS